ncbi:DUF3016 domain-containing protein [Shewanella glacialipiscicola]|uniref:DUF3016 domain-containing protein n=1 Tax=Shewanella glacialipiscicola TaxID=614069 RepID=A0ABQ6IXR5_9GAMM|nr:DUF3016 domain-containing protein [Shewanella glacialipiscicola]MCL1086628.1 DUF3016 domain-containing protein [Shewanella glacialipiscicola]GIU07469.1 hypothetical protein TUM4636_10870 [Shewanella glacialipiscicola]GMA80683.1 hypothetical protein GCM10025855_02160 [Shewanella glacialipiscicola]
MKIQSLILASVLSCSAAWAAEEAPVNPVTEDGVVKIIWQNPKEFRDIKSSGEIQSRYEKRLFETLTKNVNKEASKILKPNQKLEMTMTDVDLAGDMRPTFGATTDDLRVIKDIYPPRMTFSYQILENDKVIIVGEEKLSDMGFLGGIHSSTDKPFVYETKMLTEWLKKTIAPQL